MRRLLVLLLTGVVLSSAAATAGPERTNASWLVRAGANFQRAGEYTVRLRNTRLQDAIDAYGEPSRCRVVGSNNHVVVTWPSRGIWIDNWTYGGLPEDEDGCMSPDLIYVSEIKLTDKRWTTSLGLHVGDRTTKLRKLYPRALYVPGSQKWERDHYYLVYKRGPCIGVCTAYEERAGVEYARLMAQVKGGSVVAFWIPVFGQGE